MSRTYSTSKPIIHSRESSNDSRTSYSSRSSTEGHYSSSRSSMANGGPSYTGESSREHKYRTADDDRKYISGTTSTSRSGQKVEVINQRRVIYDRDAPTISDASSEHYKKTQERERKHKSSSHRK